MSVWSDLAERARVLVRRSREERELAEELSFHLEMQTEKNIREGMAPEEARRQAQLALGGAERVKEEVREARGTRLIEDLHRDVGFALRTLRRNKAFATTTLVILALGIGANTATFTVIDALILRELPVPEPERLITIGDPSRTGSLSQGTPRADLASYPLYTDLRDQQQVVTGLYASGRTGRLDVTIGAAAADAESMGVEAEHARGRLVSGNYFSVLRVPAYLGRTFTSNEDRAPGADPVVVISHSYWQRRFGEDRSVVGRVLTINGTPLTIVGVGPPGFSGDIVGQPTDIWIPLMMQPSIMPHREWLGDRGASWLLLMGRLAPGVTLAQARSVLSELMERSLLEHAAVSDAGTIRNDLRGQPVMVESGARGFSYYRRALAPSLLTLMVTVGLVLLVVCGNVGNLMLARAARRGREMSMRMALGAGRLRLVQQLLTESLLLAMMGGALGLLLARWGGLALLHLAGGGTRSIPLDVRMDARVFGFTFLVSLLTAVVFGLVPALRTTQVELASALRAGRGVTGTGGRRRKAALSKVLVVVQFALSLLLLVGTAMLVRTARRLQDAELGLARDRLVIAKVDAAPAGYNGARLAALVRGLTERVSRVGDVAGVSVSENGIFSGTESTTTLRVEGFTAQTSEDTTVAYDDVGPDYFGVIGARLLAGRDFDARDSESGQKVAVVNETMARFYFPKSSPIGRQVTLDSATYEIVGVVADVEGRSVRGAPTRRLYLPMAQIGSPPVSFYMEIRAEGNDPAHLLVPIRRALRDADPSLVVLGVDPVTELIRESISEDRLVSQVVTFFGALALVLASLGLYGVMAYATSRRTGEFGLRMALGAKPRDVTRMMLKEAMTLTAAGVIVGLPAALAAAQLLRNQLFGIEVFDPPSVLLAIAVLAASAWLAGYLPALRASRVPPLDALRIE